MAVAPTHGNDADVGPVRADQWLWAARFFKTRALARDALNGGKVERNGASCKPSKPISIGDRLIITKDRVRFEIVVCGLSAKRGPASIAQTLYEESAESIARREEQRLQAKVTRPVHPDRRPDKAARRQLRRLKHNQ